MQPDLALVRDDTAVELDVHEVREIRLQRQQRDRCRLDLQRRRHRAQLDAAIDLERTLAIDRRLEGQRPLAVRVGGDFLGGQFEAFDGLHGHRRCRKVLDAHCGISDHQPTDHRVPRALVGELLLDLASSFQQRHAQPLDLPGLVAHHAGTHAARHGFVNLDTVPVQVDAQSLHGGILGAETIAEIYAVAQLDEFDRFGQPVVDAPDGRVEAEEIPLHRTHRRLVLPTDPPIAQLDALDRPFGGLGGRRLRVCRRQPGDQAIAQADQAQFAVPAHGNCRIQAVDRDAAHHEAGIDQVGLADLGIETLPADEVDASCLCHHEVADVHGTGHGQREGLVADFLENNLEFRIQAAGIDAHRHPVRHIGLQCGEVETVEVERQLALVLALEDFLALPLQRERRAIDRRRKTRLHDDFRLIGQAGDERHLELEVLDGMHPPFRLVVEDELAAADLDVVQREARRRRRLRGCQPLVEQVGYVVAPFIDAHHGQARSEQADFVDHGAPLKQRETGKIHEEFVEARHFAPACFPDRDVGDPRRQRVGIDIDVPDADIPPQFLGELADEQRFGQRRTREVAEQPEGDGNPAQPESNAPQAAELVIRCCRGGW